MKRFLMATIAVFVISATSLVFWQPAFISRWIFTKASMLMAQKTPFAFTAERMSGNIVTGFTFIDVRFLQKSDHSEVFRTRSLSVRLNLWSLVARRVVQIDNLSLEAGGGEVVLKGRLPSASSSGAFHIEDRVVALEKIPSAGKSLQWPLHLEHTGVWDVSLDSQTWTVDMKGRLGDAPIDLHGTWGPSDFYRLRGSWTQASLSSVWRDPAARGVQMTAALNVSGHGTAVNGTMDLQGHDQSASAQRQMQGTVRFKEGTGVFRMRFGMNQASARIYGTMKLPQRSLTAVVDSEHLLWQQRRLGKLTMTVDANEERVKARASLQNLQWQEGSSSPGDIVSAVLSMQGKAPRWQIESSAQLRNGSVLEMAGQSDRPASAWTLMWDKLSVSVPDKGVWTAKPKGSIAWHAGGQTEVRHLLLKNGPQSIEVPHASLGKDAVQADIDIHALDPGPWLALAGPDISAAGAIQASLHLRGSFAHPNVDGYINAKLERMMVDSLGLAFKEVDIDLRSSDQGVEVRKFVGITKKGNVQITGRSRLPNLDFSLQAKDLAFQTKTHSKGVGDLTLHVSGALNAPLVEGKLTLKEAIYMLPPKDKESKKDGKGPAEKVASSASGPMDILWRRSRLDFRALWSNDVWYRDGVTSIETHADLRVQKAQDASLVRWTGSIRSVRGSYNYFGRDFTIESGEIQFTGSPEPNPNLNVEASYRRDPTVVYLDITGTADKPILKLRSSPPLSDQDIMSVIVFGQPLNELRSKSGGQSANQAAMQAAGGVLGSFLSKSLRETGLKELDIDVLDIEPTQEGSQLTVGRYLTRKLFVSYGQAIRGSAEKSISADYFLTDKWTLQGASDSLEGNYMDFLFRYPLNKKNAASNTSPLPVSPFRNTLDQVLPNQPKAAGVR